MIRGLPPRGGGQGSRNGDSGPAQRRDDIGPEDPGPVVVVIQAHPGNRPGLRRRPQRQGHRLARARRTGDNGQRAPARALGDQPGDPRPRRRPARHARRCDLRCQHRHSGPGAPGRRTGMACAGRCRDGNGPVIRPGARDDVQICPTHVTP